MVVLHLYKARNFELLIYVYFVVSAMYSSSFNFTDSCLCCKHALMCVRVNFSCCPFLLHVCCRSFLRLGVSDVIATVREGCKLNKRISSKREKKFATLA